MRPSLLRSGLLAPLFAIGCSGPLPLYASGDAGGSPYDGGTETTDDGGTPTDDAGSPDANTGLDAGTSMLYPVTFSYTPGWKGAKGVGVIGGFGQSNDWQEKAPFVVLQDNGSGTFTGTAMLPAGQYPYLIGVVGDAASATPAKFKRAAVDPLNPAVAACPSGSPTYDPKATAPCSELTVPQPAVVPTHQLTGTVTVDGQPAAGWLVLAERVETPLVAYFANRVDSWDPLESTCRHASLSIL